MTILEAWVFASPFLVLAIAGSYAFVARREMQQVRQRSASLGQPGKFN